MKKKEYSCSVSSAGASVDYVSSVDLVSKFNEGGYNQYIPEIVISEKTYNNGYRVHFTDSDACTVSYKGKNASILYPWELMRKGETILYAGYPLIEQQHQSNQSATVHAGCVGLDGQGILLIGESGCGKTTLVTKLCQNNQAKLYSNELAIVGLSDQELYCSGGTKFFLYRRESIARSIPCLSELFPVSTEDSWSQKIFVKPEVVGISVGEGTIPLKKVYRIHVDESKNSLTVLPADNFSARLNLNENLTRYVRNTVTMVIGRDNEIIGDVPSMDRPEFFTWRKRAIEIIMKEQNSLYLSGPSDKMVDLIIRQ